MRVESDCPIARGDSGVDCHSGSSQATPVAAALAVLVVWSVDQVVSLGEECTPCAIVFLCGEERVVPDGKDCNFVW
jgi:hypothetical protein